MFRSVLPASWLITLFLLQSCSSNAINPAFASDIEAIHETNRRVRSAFLNQNLEEILTYHHPKVEKALAWDVFQKGHDDMSAGLMQLFASHTVEFFDDESTPLESLEVFGDSAVMIKRFKLRGVAKRDDVGDFVFEGRTMIVYVRYAQSPTGWVTMREMIMPPPAK